MALRSELSKPSLSTLRKIFPNGYPCKQCGKPLEYGGQPHDCVDAPKGDDGPRAA